MSSSPVHDLGAHRRESATRPRETRPLFSREPLSHDRERRPPAQPPKKRKRNTPTTPAFTFNPRDSNVPSGRQVVPVSPPALPRPSASESLTNPYDGQQATHFADREICTPLHDGWSRTSTEHSSTEHATLSYPNTPYTDVNDAGSAPPNSSPPDSYDSPASYASSSSPAPSDQSPSAVEFVAPGIDYTRQAQPSMIMCPYEGQMYVPVGHHGSYVYTTDPCPDRPVQVYPAQYMDPSYGRPGLHGGPAYPGNNGYPFTQPRRS